VLLLVDISYLSRFWTQFEAWCAMQRATPAGLRGLGDVAIGAEGRLLSEQSRCTIQCLHNATAGAEDAKLVAMWAHVTPTRAHEQLARPDVLVTNASDKQTQLARIASLDADVRQAFSETEARRALSTGVSAAELVSDGFLLQTLRAAGCTAGQLRGADCSAFDTYTAGYTAHMMREAGFSAGELLAVPCSVPARQLFDAGFGLGELKAAGLMVAEAFELAASLSDLRDAGYSCADLLYTLGRPVKELHDAGYTARELKDTKKFGRARQLKDLGINCFQAAQMSQAIQHFSDALEICPNAERQTLLSNLSACHLALHQFDKALKAANECIKVAPHWAKAHSRKGAALRELKRDAEALKAYEQALQLDPTSEHIKGAVQSLKQRLAPSASLPAGFPGFGADFDNLYSEISKNPDIVGMAERVARDLAGK
jgi:tetratricopeptide (TPR) repeat protein